MLNKEKEIDKTLYTETSIESLDPREFTRLKPGVYAGDCTYSTQLLVEIFSNAVDEFRLGHGEIIKVTLKDRLCIVEDDGQGFIPNSFRDDGTTILEAAFSVLNTSGKYREDGTYEGTSLGSFGIGSKITNFLSHWLEVITYRDGSFEHIWFKEGQFDHRGSGEWRNNTTGTLVQWEPSEEFFTHPEVNVTEIKNLFKTVAALCPGLRIQLDNNGEKTDYYSTKGLNDLVDEAVAGKELINNRFDLKYANGKNKLDMVMTYTSNYSMTMVPYVNTGLTSVGPHITQIKALLTREFNKFFKEKKWLKENEDNLAGDDIQEGLYIVFNITAPNVAYDAQVKTRITKLEMTPFTSALAEELRIWFLANEKDIKAIADKAKQAKKAREAAQRARDAARLPKDKKSKLLNLPTKLVDCWSKDRNKCELLISEGDSAAGGLVEARNSEFQAVFPIRGKIISCYKNSTDKIFANAEVVNIIKALGLDLDQKTHKLIYDKKRLRYGSVILCADGDPDGEAIKNLLLTFFWALCPELIINGHIHVAVPPLFRITTKKNEYIFLRDGVALEAYKKEHTTEKFLVNRNKGLGEQDPDELAYCLLHPDTRNVNQITVSDIKETEKMFEIFMGQSVPPRRQWILEHSEEAQN